MSVRNGCRSVPSRCAAKRLRPPRMSQLIEYDSESIDIRGGRNRFAAHLLGTGVFWRHDLVTGLGQAQIAPRRIQQLGNAEIQQFRNSILRYEDVCGFDVTVYDEVSVRVFNCCTHTAEQLQSRPQRRSIASAILVNGYSINIFHYQI